MEVDRQEEDRQEEDHREEAHHGGDHQQDLTQYFKWPNAQATTSWWGIHPTYSQENGQNPKSL